jgi:hypothetical protein
MLSGVNVEPLNNGMLVQEKISKKAVLWIRIRPDPKLLAGFGQFLNNNAQF